MNISEAIISSFKQLKQSSSYSKITVAALCQEAKISKQTFYNHFNSKEAVLQMIIYKDIRYPVDEIRKHLPTEKIKSSGMLLIEKVYLNLDEEKAFYLCFRSANELRILADLIFRELYSMNMVIMKNYKGDEIELEYLKYHCSHSNASLISKWIQDGMVVPPKTMAHFFYKWVLKNLEDYYGNGNDERRFRTGPDELRWSRV